MRCSIGSRSGGNRSGDVAARNCQRLRTALRRKRIAKAFGDRAIAELAGLPITVDAETDRYAWTTTLQLADQFELTPHDAADRELARCRTLPIAALDEPLRDASPARGVALLGTS